MLTVQVAMSTALGGPVALLEDMVAGPRQRANGIGSVLLRAAIEQCERLGCLRITLLTDADNAQARLFYRRHGFVHSAMAKCAACCERSLALSGRRSKPPCGPGRSDRRPGPLVGWCHVP